MLEPDLSKVASGYKLRDGIILCRMHKYFIFNYVSLITSAE